MNSDLEREFYCTLKLVSGEEIVSLIMVDDTDALDPLIILQEPIVIQYSTQGAFSQIKLEPCSLLVMRLGMRLHKHSTMA